MEEEKILKVFLKYRKSFIMRFLGKILLPIIGVDIPNDVVIEGKVIFPYNSYGTVIHPNTVIKNGVKIYQNVTIGRADIYNDFSKSNMESIIIEEDVILCAGAKILAKDNKLVIGKGTIVAANAVLLESTGAGEVWAGIPAQKVSVRKGYK